MNGILIVGAGPATGSALCAEFSKDHKVALVARSADRLAKLTSTFANCAAFPCDVSDREQWLSALTDIEAFFGGVPGKIVFNTEGGGLGTYDVVDLDRFADSFPIMVTSLLMMAQTWFPRAIEKGQAVKLLVNSSPIGFEAQADYTGLGPGRMAQRALAENLREATADTEIEVGMLSINGAIDEIKMRTYFPDRADEDFIAPATIASLTRDIFAASPIAFHNEIKPVGGATVA